MRYIKRRTNRKLRKKRILIVIAGLLLITGIIVGLVSLLHKSNEQVQHAAYPQEYQEIVNQYTTQFQVESSLVYAVMKAESGFDPHAHSGADARGLMQITPETFDWLQWQMPDDPEYTDEDLYNPEINIRYGCKFLSILQGTYQDLGTCIAAYNAGMGNVNRWLSDGNYSDDGITLKEIPYPETKTYVQRVLNNYQQYKSLYNSQK